MVGDIDEFCKYHVQRDKESFFNILNVVETNDVFIYNGANYGHCFMVPFLLETIADKLCKRKE